MLPPDRHNSVPRLVALVLFPVIVFYGCLFYTSRNIPWLDDYDAGLDVADHFVQLHSFSERFIYYLGLQHNEYKLFIGHGLVWLQLALTGHINFAVISALANISILFLGIVLWKMFLPETRLERRLALFLPVSLLLFQFQYVETLNWPMSAVQHLMVFPFSIGSLYLLDRSARPGPGTRMGFAGAVLLLVLAVSASINAFAVAAAGMLLLVLRRFYGRLTVWIGVSAVCGWAYAFHYHASNPHEKHGLLLNALRHPHIAFVLGFVGSSGRYPFMPGAVAFGAALCVFFGWMIRRGYLRRQPVVGYCLLFILMTSIGVAGIRAELGLASSVSSRYRSYSDLLLIFAWFALVTEFRLAEAISLRRNRLFVATLSFCMLFWVVMDAIGIHHLHKRAVEMDEGMHRFEQSHGTLSPVYSIDGEVLGYPGFDEHARQILIQAEQAGTYEPKQY